MKRENAIFISLAACSISFVNGQQIVSSTAYLKTEKGSVSFCMDKPAPFYGIGSDFMLAQGFLQPQISIQTLVKPPEDTDVSVQLDITSNILKVQYSGKQDDLVYRLYQTGGILLETGSIAKEETKIRMKSYKAGTYLFILNQEDKETASYKIIKQ